jgi:hypothetical protein
VFLPVAQGFYFRGWWWITLSDDQPDPNVRVAAKKFARVLNANTRSRYLRSR